MSDSYPFLAISKQFNVPYGAVLLFADRIDALWRNEQTSYWHKWAVREVNRHLGKSRDLMRSFQLAINRSNGNDGSSPGSRSRMTGRCHLGFWWSARRSSRSCPRASEAKPTTCSIALGTYFPAPVFFGE